MDCLDWNGLLYTISRNTFPEPQPDSASYSQTIKAKELKFWEKGHLLPSVTCQMSCVTFRKSHVTCNMSIVMFCFFWTKWRSYSVEGLFSTGPTLSNFYYVSQNIIKAKWHILKVRIILVLLADTFTPLKYLFAYIKYFFIKLMFNLHDRVKKI